MIKLKMAYKDRKNEGGKKWSHHIMKQFSGTGLANSIYTQLVLQ